MRNIYREFLDLIPGGVLDVGEVVAVGTGVATVLLPGGGILQARGQATVGERVFVMDGVVQGPAPTLSYVEGEG